jgi:hypothetical protein
MSDEQRAALLGNAALLLLAANRTASAREIAVGLAARCPPSPLVTSWRRRPGPLRLASWCVLSCWSDSPASIN